ncbi:hypothetical protein VIVU109784_22480 [Vibrio vulnificus]
MRICKKCRTSNLILSDLYANAKLADENITLNTKNYKRADNFL